MAVHEAPVVIKKVKKVSGGGHHGGAWKVAYADFVTAMMAFFLLMWLVNATSPEQKQGVADYFAPASVSESRSGSGGILAGTALGEDGAMQAGSMNFVEQKSLESPQQDGGKAAADLEQASEEALREEIQKREDAAFRSAAQSLRQAMQDMPELAELSKNIIVDQTPEGLRIQLIDQEGRAMFDPGSAKPNERARTLLRAIGRVINQLPNRVSITGHTSAETVGAGNSADWPLSSARADASRQLLESSGIDSDRVAQVSGKAAKEPLYPNDPTLAGNRRIAIVLLREAPVLPEDPAL